MLFSTLQYPAHPSTWNLQVLMHPLELRSDFTNFPDPSLVAPVCVTVLSMILFALQGAWKAIRILRSRENSDILVAEGIGPTISTTSSHQRFGEHVNQHGGKTIFTFKVIRLIGACILSGLFTRSFVLIRRDEVGLAEDPLIAASQCACFVYALLLALLSVLLGRKLSVVAIRHLNCVNFFFFVAFAFRDLVSLATFDQEPLDDNGGNLLWVKIAVLFLNSIAIPLLVPRQYIPVDPKNPSKEPNAEQTASILSLTLYGFLDSIIFLAYRIPHLPYDLLPPLADYDEARHLTENALPHLDPFKRGDKRHLFWGLMRIFRRDYLILAVTVVMRTFAAFASPVGIKQLLNYLETGGEGAHYKPWVWIIWLFLGPMTYTIAWQWFMFIGTRMGVRAECILTQLILEHSLRVRMKAEVDTKASPVATTTSTSSDDEDLLDEEGPSETHRESSHSLSASAATESSTAYSSSEDATAQASSSSVTSKSSRNIKERRKPSDPTVVQTTSPKGGMDQSPPSNLIGKINNLVTTDIQNIVDSRHFFIILVETPLSISLCITFLYSVLGWSAFAGLATIILLLPLTGVVANRARGVQSERMKRTDGRIQIVTETMNVVRMIKLFGWERKLSERIAEKREEELGWLWKVQILEMANVNLRTLNPLITMLVTFASYSMAVFDLLRDQIQVVYYTLTQAITGKVSLDRLNDFLHNTELLDQYQNLNSEEPTLHSGSLDKEAIGFRDATFTWSNDANGSLTPSKRSFSLRIQDELILKPGRINLIVGPTGSGKTSLLMALLGEMHFRPCSPESWYNLPRSQGVAYAAQESWVLNETIKNNILFGSPYDEQRYKDVLYQCSLEQDLQIFEAGDATEVGEKGLTLSGGQKARLTLARAVYSPARLLLLDDVLAALDVHTAKWIVDKCFKSDLLRGRTVLLVTHNIAIIRPIAAFCVSVGIDGFVQEQALEDIASDDSIDGQEEIEALFDHQEGTRQHVPLALAKEANGKLIAAEEIAEGHVGLAAFMLYFRGLGGSRPLLFFSSLILGIFVSQGFTNAQTWFLGYWASQYNLPNPAEVNVAYYSTVYGLVLFSGIFVYSILYTTYLYGLLRASRGIHRRLVESVLGATSRWLDTTPISRVLIRCTQDIRAIDGQLPAYIWVLSAITISMIIKISAVIFLTPTFFLPAILATLIGGWCGRVFIKAQLSTKREMSNAKAPVIGHFGAAISGLTSLRAYGTQESFKFENFQKLNHYTRVARTVYILNQWACIRIEAVGALFASGLAALLIYVNTNSALNTGFSINMAVGFSRLILWWVRMLNAVEIESNSLERLHAYIEIEHEKKPTQEGIPPASWPTSGELHVENLSARYSRDGPRVLHNLSFYIKSGERIGVGEGLPSYAAPLLVTQGSSSVGRTGSGKSSLTLSLLQCIPTEGRIVYAGIDIESVNLDVLRANITIIPQVPELLSGSLRENLDPFDQYDDTNLNAALRAAGLFALQSEMSEGRLTLDSTIAGGGGNLSIGQRQIIALARAIVRGSKLLILDEATSAIDYRTDSIIQSSLRNELRGDVTLITIAHRLRTIMDADKIMVLEAGCLVEFGPPSELLKDPESKLRSLVDESSDRDLLYEMAKQAT